MKKNNLLMGIPTDKEDKFVKMLEILEGLTYSDAKFLLQRATEKIESLAIVNFEVL